MLTISELNDYVPELLALTRQMVQIESPSTDKAAVDRLGEIVVDQCRALGANVTAETRQTAGNHLVARWGESSGYILALCHLDTVWECGTLARRPFHQEGDRLYGPGVLDMKAGIAMLLTVLKALKRVGRQPCLPLTILFTSDEEIGSFTSRSLIEDLGRHARLVLCLEPTRPDGSVKTWRKGTGQIVIEVKGVAAHAGVDHEKGRNAIEELAHLVLAVQRLTDYATGTTTNVGVIQGGRRPNVVPDAARAVVDFRIMQAAELDRLVNWAAGLKSVLPGTEVSARVEADRPPMPRNALMEATFQKALSIARRLPLELTEGGTGGGSDANFIAPLGIPLLDGVGVQGGGSHAEDEHVDVSTLATRSALLSALLTEWERP